MDKFIAVGYTVTDNSIAENGKVENYGEKEFYQEATSSWLYTHMLHNNGASISIRGVGNCPSCGQYAIVKVREINEC